MFDWQTPGYPEDIDRELRVVAQDEADRVAQHQPFPNRAPASGPLPLLAGGRRAHLFTDQEARVIASCLQTCAAALADAGDQATVIGGLRRDLLAGIGEAT